MISVKELQKSIINILSTMGEGLAYADATEMLPDEQKAEVLNRHKRESNVTKDHKAVFFGEYGRIF